MQLTLIQMADLEDYICPITHQIFSDPVIASDQQVYERDAITKWYQTNKTSPITGQPIKEDFYSCFLITRQISRLLKEKPELRKEKYFDLDKLIEKHQLTDIDHWLKIGEDQLIEIFEDLRKNYEIDLDLIQDPQDNWKLINLACRCSMLKVIKYLINQGVDLENPTRMFHRPIHLACTCASIDIIKLLIEHQVDLKAKTTKGFLPIHHIFQRKKDLLEGIKLLAQQKEVDFGIPTSAGAYPIHLAIRKSTDLETIKYLVEVLEVDLNARKGELTPLHYSVEFLTPDRLENYHYLLSKQRILGNPQLYVSLLKDNSHLTKYQKLRIAWDLQRKFLQAQYQFPVYQVLPA